VEGNGRKIKNGEVHKAMGLFKDLKKERGSEAKKKQVGKTKIEKENLSRSEEGKGSLLGKACTVAASKGIKKGEHRKIKLIVGKENRLERSGEKRGLHRGGGGRTSIAI